MKKIASLVLFVFLSISLYAQEADEVLMVVGKKPVTVSDFLYAYQKSNQHTHKGMSQYLEDYKNYKLKVAYAELLGYDTLAVVRQQMNYFQQCMAAGVPVQSTPLDKSGLHGLSLYVGHLILPLPQHAPTSGYQYRLKTRMDSIYAQIQGGQDFMAVVNAVSPTTRNAYWISRNQTLQEVENRAFRLNEGEMSEPFLDYDGYHLIKVFQKSEKPEIGSVETSSQLLDSHLFSEYRDGLLLNELYKNKEFEEKVPTENELEAFFNSMHKNYEWDIPRFKGVVYHCKDKKTLKAVAKLFKKYPMEQWENLAQNKAYDALFKKVEMGQVRLYKLSQDPYVDALAFGGPKQAGKKEFPFNGISGKKLKKGPDTYADVREQVEVDYQVAKQILWMDEMKKQIPLDVDMKVFKRINK